MKPNRACFKMILKTTVIMLILFYMDTSKAEVDETLDDAKLNFTGLSTKYGLICQEFDFTTEDGYILKMFHIPGNKSKPLILVHGMVDSSDTLLLRGYTSIGYLMSKAGYDVWAYNYRGNRYSRRHVTLNPDTDKAFWDFSMHEHGVYDLAAAIDLVLNQTGMRQVAVSGYSEGAVLIFTLGSVRPEYNDKINIFIAMTPICYLHHIVETIPVIKIFVETLRMIALRLGVEEILNHDSVLGVFVKNFCSRDTQFCLSTLSALGEMEEGSIDNNYMRVLTSHYPSGTSRKNLEHYYQIMLSGRFAQYDYGPVTNLAKYKSRKSPLYDLKKVRVKLAILMGENDLLSTKEGTDLLKKDLPNIVFYKSFENFNHFTLGHGKYAPERVFPYIFTLLEKYT